MQKSLLWAVIFTLVACGCVASSRGKGQGDNIITTSSANVMINPPMQGQNNVLVKITNPTNQTNIDLCGAIRSGLAKKGYKLVEYPEQANYQIMGNIVQAGRTDAQLLKEAYRSKYGTRLFLQEPKQDLLATAVGKLVRPTQGKTYILILDLNIQNRQKSKDRVVRQNGKTRIVSGVENTRIAEKQVMSTVQERVTQAVVSMF